MHQVVHALYQLKLLSVIIEGGAQVLQSFIDDHSWDEARVITNDLLIIGEGVPAPVLSDQQLVREEIIEGDRIAYYVSA